MNADGPLHELEFGRGDELGMADFDGVDLAVELAVPEVEELLEGGKFRSQV